MRLMAVSSDYNREYARRAMQRMAEEARAAGLKSITVYVTPDVVIALDKVKKAHSFSGRGEALNYIIARLAQLPATTREDIGL